MLPDPCAATTALLAAALPIHLQGYDNSAEAVACISDVKSGTDVLVVRHTQTCVAGTANCDADGVEGPLFQASLCNNASELGSSNIEDHFALDTDTSKLTRHRRDCTPAAGSGTLAPARRFLTHIYFIANNDQAGDGIPTLKRAELKLRDGQLGLYEVPLAEGIENMQLEYGIDTTADGVADLFTADPATADGCEDTACVPKNWRRVVSVKLNLLSRNTEKSPGYSDTRTYVLGNKADGSANRVAAQNDGYKRHVFQALVPLPNPVGRKQP
jgi:type IV pilus assembly protein PilW